MSGAEIVAVLSGIVNVVGAIAGLLGWRRHRRVRETAERVERTGEAVIQGVEACERLVGSSEAQAVKQSVRAVAEAAGVEDNLHDWLTRLGLSK
jgi:hypothetical protein